MLYALFLSSLDSGNGNSNNYNNNFQLIPGMHVSQLHQTVQCLLWFCRSLRLVGPADIDSVTQQVLVVGIAHVPPKLLYVLGFINA